MFLVAVNPSHESAAAEDESTGFPSNMQQSCSFVVSQSSVLGVFPHVSAHEITHSIQNCYLNSQIIDVGANSLDVEVF